MEIEVKLVVPENALSPIVVTEFGMTMDFKFVAPRKAVLAIVVTLLGITKLVCEFAAGYAISMVLVLLNSAPLKAVKF